jgi:hypothetical protein
MHNRRIWARGLTANESGKAITVDGQRHFLRNAEHYDGRTMLTVVTTIELPHDAEVTVHE